ncbi:MAG: hypothetical protein CME62_02440 [Halobacteriovoraceae bacterium]|nr:hypothetical protein [Halobacteriovoraceae bacterium]
MYSHLNLHTLVIQVLDLNTSKSFYKRLFELISSVGAEEVKCIEAEQQVQFVGKFILIIEQIKETTYLVDPTHRVGIKKFSLSVNSPQIIDEINRQLTNVNIVSLPQSYDYAEGYYAYSFLDPDGIEVELVYQDSIQ